jgi:hypothetical protein
MEIEYIPEIHEWMRDGGCGGGGGGWSTNS